MHLLFIHTHIGNDTCANGELHLHLFLRYLYMHLHAYVCIFSNEGKCTVIPHIIINWELDRFEINSRTPHSAQCVHLLNVICIFLLFTKKIFIHLNIFMCYILAFICHLSVSYTFRYLIPAILLSFLFEFSHFFIFSILPASHYTYVRIYKVDMHIYTKNINQEFPSVLYYSYFRAQQKYILIRMIY